MTRINDRINDRIGRTQRALRRLRLARYRMARERARELPCFAEIAHIIDAGPTAEQLARATFDLAHIDDPQLSLI